MIIVERLKIHNYKCFKDFEIDFNDGLSINKMVILRAYLLGRKTIMSFERIALWMNIH